VHAPATLRQDELGKSYVDKRQLASAFSHLTAHHPTILAKVVLSYGVSTLCEIGCGTAPLLRAICRLNPNVRGWALDPNAHMCEVAAEAAKQDGVSDRITLRCGGLEDIQHYITKKQRLTIDAVYASSVFNEFFRAGEDRCVQMLRRLRTMFTGKLLFVVDYYGKLGHAAVIPPGYRYTLLQDIAQVLTGQGVPPSDAIGWTKLYKAAGLELIENRPYAVNGVDTFLHVLRLK
jgi:SAM-dependent methyltransferase